MKRTGLLLASLSLAACGGSDEPSAVTTGSEPSTVTNGVDQAYVAHVLKASAFDFAQCRRQPGMGGLEQPDAIADEVIVALDSSGSMAGASGSVTKMDEARRAVSAYLSGLPQGMRGGLAVFGDIGDNRPASKAKSCAAPVRFAVPAGLLDPARVNAATATLRPAGWTPLAAAISSAARSFTVPDTKRRMLFVVSDGIESCGGDPVAAARAARANANVVVNVIGFDVSAAGDIQALEAVAAAGGGRYIAARPGQLLIALRGAANAAQSANTVSAAKALGQMDSCYRTGLEQERVALEALYQPDVRSGKINTATASAITSASLKRFNKSYAEFARISQQNYDRANAKNNEIEGQVPEAR